MKKIARKKSRGNEEICIYDFMHLLSPAGVRQKKRFCLDFVTMILVGPRSNNIKRQRERRSIYL